MEAFEEDFNEKDYQCYSNQYQQYFIIFAIEFAFVETAIVILFIIIFSYVLNSYLEEFFWELMKKFIFIQYLMVLIIIFFMKIVLSYLFLSLVFNSFQIRHRLLKSLLIQPIKQVWIKEALHFIQPIIHFSLYSSTNLLRHHYIPLVILVIVVDHSFFDLELVFIFKPCLSQDYLIVHFSS